jgi:hypothetical protein
MTPTCRSDQWHCTGTAADHCANGAGQASSGPPIKTRPRSQICALAHNRQHPELYAGKLVAALDRQHPRDLFDVQLMLAGSGWSEPLLDCFVVYLAAHNRPTHEVLFPREKALDTVFENEFVGMTSAPVSVDQLLATRQRMMRELPRVLHPRHRQFLLSIVRAEPQWDLLPYAHIV